ncbi:hypothetical protein RHSIM_RhsimUnG0115000 [Rhododendron simsii]|uniref:MLO-like protein n=1 Tax=Rhododendron simsii TaxID=118357 RepID=A0A834L2J5_RHOSS|nr:hypothetical protein RHSIM_RhsimUnG0115000 [Rhododendron simsii]
MIMAGHVPFVSTYGIHQLHIFIFVLAVFHVLYCIITLALGRAKMRKWKAWEMETKTTEYQFTNDPERFRFTRDTSFGRRHLNFWSHSPFLLWTACFFRQFVTSVPKVDYLTLRHGFISAHLGPQSRTNFDFQKYIKRSLEEDFKIILLIGTKLQVIITKMGLRIQDRGDIVKGTPMVQPGDELFWFNRPRLLLYLIQFILFQNAFQLAFFAWARYEFGLRSCFHEKLEDMIIRLTMGVLIQIVCSYVTLPLYALVTQMGSNMKPTIFNDQIAKGLRNWHQTAKKHIKQNRHSPCMVTPLQSVPGTPLHGASPVHLLRNCSSEIDIVSMYPRVSNFENVVWESDGPPSRHCDSHRDLVVQQETEGVQESSLVTSASGDGEVSLMRNCGMLSYNFRLSLTNLVSKFEDFFSIEGDIAREQFASLFRSTPSNQLHEEQETAMELEIDTRAHVNSSPLNLTPKDNLCSEEVEDMPVELEVNARARFYNHHLFERLIEYSTILRGGKLFQKFLVDGWASTEQNRLTFYKMNQGKFRVELYEDLKGIGPDELGPNQIGKRVVLPSSFTGGPRHMFEIFQDSMAITRYNHHPDIFLTVTANPSWPEIIAALLPRQKAIDRPDLIARVFELKRKAFDEGDRNKQSVR